jgi:hypothetical protein
LEQIFSGLGAPAAQAIGTSATYFALVILLRVAGQRTLAKWYAFDFIVTVALGSTFANGVLSKEAAVAQSVLGFVNLGWIAFRHCVDCLALESHASDRQSRPTLVLQRPFHRQRHAQPACGRGGCPSCSKAPGNGGFGFGWRGNPRCGWDIQCDKGPCVGGHPGAWRFGSPKQKAPYFKSAPPTPASI